MAILVSDTAMTLSTPDSSTRASCMAASASNLLGAVSNGSRVSFAISAANFSPKPLGAFNPVPTAVPPWARDGRAAARLHPRDAGLDLEA